MSLKVKCREEKGRFKVFEPNNVLQQTGHANDGSARFNGNSRVSQLLSEVVRRRSNLARSAIIVVGDSVVGLGEDERYDFMRRFAARSALKLEVVCERLRQRLADKYALPDFCFDAEMEGDDLRSWGESRSDFIGLAVTVAADYLDVGDFARIYGAPADANYHLHLFWNSKKVSHDEARKIKDVLSDALESALVNLPLKYFA